MQLKISETVFAFQKMVTVLHREEEKQAILFIRRCHLSGRYNPTLLPNWALLCAPGDKNIESPHAHAVHWVQDC